MFHLKLYISVWEQSGNKSDYTGNDDMIETIRQVLSRSEATFIQDMIGAVSLMAILVVLLHLPSF